MCILYMLIEHTFLFHCLPHFFRGIIWRTSTVLPLYQHLLSIDHPYINTVIITKICLCSRPSQESMVYFELTILCVWCKNIKMDDKFIIQVFNACQGNVAGEV